jgi:hypothetical protein
VKVRFDKTGYPLYCDAGPYEGDMRIDLSIRLYLSPEEYARYGSAENLRVTLKEDGGTRLPEAPQAQPARGTASLTACDTDPVLLPGDGTREVRLGGAAARLHAFDTSVADARQRYDGITFVCDEAGQRVAAIVPVPVADFAIRHGALR